MANSLTHSLPVPILNARYTLPMTFRVSAGTPTDPTTPDTEISTDGGATFADTAEEITTGGGNGCGYLTLTGAETNNSVVFIAGKSANDVTTPVIILPRPLAIIGSGTLSAGSAGGGTLGTLLAYDVTGCFIRSTGGTGGGGTGGANNQARKIITYNTSTGAFTVSPNWETTPSTDTTYDVLLPEGVTLGMLWALNPTTPGRTADVAATGEVGLDFNNILSSSLVTLHSLTITGNTTFTGTTTHTGNVALSNGMTITQATTNGHGMSVTGNGTGHGIYTVSGGTNSNGLLALGSGAGSGIGGWGGATGNGISGTGGATSGDGLHVVASTSGAGIHAAGAGGSADITGNLSGSVGSVTGHTPQTGDSYAYLGTNMGLLGANLTAADDATITAISGIGTAGGAAIGVDPTTDNASGGISGVTSGTTSVGTQTGTFSNVSNVDGSYHVITHAGNAIDWVYQFLTGGGTSVVAMLWSGYLTSGNDTITFSVWDHVGGAWETVGTQLGQVGTTNVTKTITLFSRHRGTSAAELGKVYVRLHCTGMTSPVLNTDQLVVDYAVTSRSVGYADGAVWVKAAGTSGTELFVNGTADNPCPFADALVIAASLGMVRFRILSGETVTLADSAAGQTLVGPRWNLALGGQDVAGAFFEGATVSGVASGASMVEFKSCVIGTCTLPATMARDCYLSGTVTMIASAGDYFFLHCGDGVAGVGSAQFTFKASCDLHLQNYSGGVDVQDMASTNTLEWGGRGNLRLMSGCTGGATLVRGAMDLVREDGNAVTLTDTARWNEDQSVASVTGAVNTTSAVKKNTARAAFPFSMIDTTTKVPVTGKTVTVTRSIDGAAFAAGTLSAVTELSDGVYLVDFAAADLNGNCIVLKATATGCDVTLERILTQP